MGLRRTRSLPSVRSTRPDGTIGTDLELDLDGGVSDPEALAEPPLEVGSQAPSGTARGRAHMQRHHRPLLRDRPGVHVMHVQDLGKDVRQVTCDLARVKAGRRTFEQDVAAFVDHAPRGSQNL